jgi:choline dehydrogenase-like flavoprotein
MHEVIIVGSGPAGVAAALELSNKGVKPLILDVGNAKKNNSPRVEGNLYAYRKQHDCFKLLIGEKFQRLSNLGNEKPVPLKLTAPNVGYVTKDAQRFSPIDETDFNAIQSFATGGLANAWSAGLYRYNDHDLEEFPFQEGDLAPYFDNLTQEIGISGTDDDLTPYFGSTRFLQPPMKLAHNAERLYRSYQRKKAVSHRFGFYLGHPRVCVLSEAKDGRPPCDYSNMEFNGKVLYRKGVLVESWFEGPEGIWVEGIQTDTNQPIRFKGKKLILAAGAINTAKIVLKTYQDFHTKLTLLDNPSLQIPFVAPSSLGHRLEIDAFGLVILNLIWESTTFNCILQGTILELTSLMRADFFADLPFSANANLALIRNLSPAMLGMQLFFPASIQSPSFLSLRENGHIHIQGQPNTIDLSKIKGLLRHFRRLGAWSHPLLVMKVPTGHTIHYAGTLPLRSSPEKKYECNPFGRLYGSHHVFIADSSGFPMLPAKNMSFTMMANAMRIADHVTRELRKN